MERSEIKGHWLWIFYRTWNPFLASVYPKVYGGTNWCIKTGYKQDNIVYLQIKRNLLFKHYLLPFILQYYCCFTCACCCNIFLNRHEEFVCCIIKNVWCKICFPCWIRSQKNKICNETAQALPFFSFLKE